jgi:glycosyltransferase involved in cell wall biosynthesis
MAGITVTIITKNEEQNILRCLESVKPFANEIVIVDSMSTDRTVDICRSFGCTIILREFDGYGPQKQFAADQARNEWVFSVDADEVISPELQQEISQLFKKEVQLFAGYRIPRSLYFMGRIMKYSGVSNEFILRLYNRNKGGFTTVPVHESIEVKGDIGTLTGKIFHYSHRDITHLIDKMNLYTSLAAQGNLKRGKSYPAVWVAIKFPSSFITYYFLKGGILDGYPGFIWSFLSAVYASMKIAKTIELKENR